MVLAHVSVVRFRARSAKTNNDRKKMQSGCLLLTPDHF